MAVTWPSVFFTVEHSLACGEYLVQGEPPPQVTPPAQRIDTRKQNSMLVHIHSSTSKIHIIGTCPLRYIFICTSMWLITNEKVIPRGYEGMFFHRWLGPRAIAHGVFWGCAVFFLEKHVCLARLLVYHVLDQVCWYQPVNLPEQESRNDFTACCLVSTMGIHVSFTFRVITYPHV